MTQSGDRIELLIDFGVAALLAVAAGFAAFVMLPLDGQVAMAGAGAVALAAFVLARQILARLARRPVRQVEFDLLPLPEFPSVEPLELGDADAIAQASPAEPQPATDGHAHALELDDELPVVGPGSRVVQLFGSPSPATAGELAVRIERHLALRDSPPHSSPDASGELFDALNQLRRSLR